MPRLVKIGTRLASCNGRLLTDANGTDCLCDGCCTGGRLCTTAASGTFSAPVLTGDLVATGTDRTFFGGAVGGTTAGVDVSGALGDYSEGGELDPSTCWLHWGQYLDGQTSHTGGRPGVITHAGCYVFFWVDEGIPVVHSLAAQSANWDIRHTLGTSMGSYKVGAAFSVGNGAAAVVAWAELYVALYATGYAWAFSFRSPRVEGSFQVAGTLCNPTITMNLRSEGVADDDDTPGTIEGTAIVTVSGVGECAEGFWAGEFERYDPCDSGDPIWISTADNPPEFVAWSGGCYSASGVTSENPDAPIAVGYTHHTDCDCDTPPDVKWARFSPCVGGGDDEYAEVPVGGGSLTPWLVGDVLLRADNTCWELAEILEGDPPGGADTFELPDGAMPMADCTSCEDLAEECQECGACNMHVEGERVGYYYSRTYIEWGLDQITTTTRTCWGVLTAPDGSLTFTGAVECEDDIEIPPGAPIGLDACATDSPGTKSVTVQCTSPISYSGAVAGTTGIDDPGFGLCKTETVAYCDGITVVHKRRSNDAEDGIFWFWHAADAPCRNVGGSGGGGGGEMMLRAAPPEGESLGLGDTIAKLTHATGLDKLAERAAHVLGAEDCGCARRRERLNQLVPYKRRRKGTA